MSIRFMKLALLASIVAGILFDYLTTTTTVEAFVSSTRAKSSYSFIRETSRSLQRNCEKQQSQSLSKFITKPSPWFRSHPEKIFVKFSTSPSSTSDPSTNPAESKDETSNDVAMIDLSEEEKKEAIGNLVANDEWNGIAMELSEIIKTAVIEDLKSKSREFLGKDEYNVGDFSKAIDAKVKDGVASLRGKDEYELGDFVLAMDEASKKLTEEITGKPYETGDLSKEIDKRIKEQVATIVGKEQYETGDLTKAIASKVNERVEELTKNYEFGDITREVNRRREEWIRTYLGEEAAQKYQFGDLTKKALTNFTGKDNYEFGDVTKKILGNFFGKKKES